MRYFKHYLLFYVIPATLISFLAFHFTNLYFLMFIGILMIILYQLIFHKYIQKETFQVFTILNIIMNILLLLCFIISQGYFSNPIWYILALFNFPYLLMMFLASLTGQILDTIIIIFIFNSIEWILCLIIAKTKLSIKSLPIIIGIIVSLIVDSYIYMQNPTQKYKGHGFTYMNGYSSTDLTDYTPYATNSKLVTLNEPSSFIIENEKDMPILDGAEACYPVYSAIAKAVYKNIDQIELNSYDTDYQNGKIVTFTNSSIGYTRLFNKEVDMFFGAKPSASQLEEAKEYNVELEYTPIGKEAFVFFVNQNNPIDTLTSNQIKSIYHGDITNWEEIGGKRHEIIAFQRPERSGSQAMMNYFMGDVSLKEPLTYEMQGGMGEIIHEVAQYHNEDGAIGYTFKYFLEGLNQEENVKILSIDGIYPTNENIKNQSYPISTYLYCVTLKDNPNPNVQKLKDYLLSQQGQYIIEETGYCSLY